jgi:multisubunit Na+/H+ antiporter MnhG subunit
MHEDNHGHSKAAWTGVAVMLVAAVAGAWAAVFGPLWLLWASLAVFALGGVVWYALARAGLGSDPERSRVDASRSRA